MGHAMSAPTSSLASARAVREARRAIEWLDSRIDWDAGYTVCASELNREAAAAGIDKSMLTAARNLLGIVSVVGEPHSTCGLMQPGHRRCTNVRLWYRPSNGAA
jgi:hypothetical protein